jgi:esterase FrsA
MTATSTRREFCSRIAATAGTLVYPAYSWESGSAFRSGYSESLFESSRDSNSSQMERNLLTDPRYQTGAKFRMHQFVQRGADPQEAEAIFTRLTDLEPEHWASEWSRFAAPLEQQAAQFESQQKTREAQEAYRKASLYYGIAKFPVINHPAKQVAYRKCIETYLKAARYFDPPLERVAIPFERAEIIGYLRKPKGVTRPPVVIATGGIDVYKEERDTSDLLDSNLAAFSTDMPGNGQCPLWYTPDAHRFYSAIIDYLFTRNDLDPNRLGILGRSYGGYWAAKMAYVESLRIKAAVQWGGPIHFTFQEPWLQHLRQEKLYLWSLLDSMIYAHHVKDYAELARQAPTLSLKEQGWLEKPAAPMLAVNGEKDPWISVQDIYLLLETGQPKTARLYPEGGHMGGDANTGKLVMDWLSSYLER